MGKLIEADALLASLRESRDRANVWLSDCREYGSEMTGRAEQAVMTFNECILRVKGAPTVDAVEVVRCKDCSKWCICHHSDNWFCADGTPINTASDFYDDKGKRLNNPSTYKSVCGERKDGDKSV